MNKLKKHNEKPNFEILSGVGVPELRSSLQRCPGGEPVLFWRDNLGFHRSSLTCLLVEESPITQVGPLRTSRSGMCSAPSSLLWLLLCRPAHLVALSCLYFVLSLKVLTPCCLPDSTGYVIPTAHYSVVEEISPDFEAALPPFRLRGSLSSGSLSHCLLLSRTTDSGPPGHVRLVPPLLQRGQAQLTQPLTIFITFQSGHHTHCSLLHLLQ